MTAVASLARTLRRLKIAREVGYASALRALALQTRLKLRGIDLRSESLAELGLSDANANRHDASNPLPIEYAFRKFGLLGSVSSAIDVGCGKGAALIAMHALGVRVLGGFDLSSRLVDICRQNLRRLQIPADVWCEDATEFSRFGDFDLFYLFNPFPPPIAEQFMTALHDASQKTGRRHLLLYRNAPAEIPFDRGPLRLVGVLDDPVIMRTLLLET